MASNPRNDLRGRDWLAVWRVCGNSLPRYAGAGKKRPGSKDQRRRQTSPPATAAFAEGKCFQCGAPVNERAPFVIQLQDGTQRRACCPHCGLMALSNPKVAMALASDYLFGRMVNVRQATFLFGSSVDLCCAPSVLCFANEADARRFQMGFGGQIYTLDQATAQLNALMALPGRQPAL